MKRLIVNVATTERYARGQQRLVQALHDLGETTPIATFGLNLPHGWPSHQEKPYAFKAYALHEYAKGFESLLWCDSSIVPIKSLEPLWQKIERDGYWIARNGWANSEWTVDSAYPDLFSGVDLEQARELNRKIPHVVATAFGLNLKHPVGQTVLEEYYQLASETNVFCGPWVNKENEYGPSEVLGHRHDQTALSVVAYRNGAELTDCPEFFAYHTENPDPRTILIARGC